MKPKFLIICSVYITTKSYNLQNLLLISLQIWYFRLKIGEHTVDVSLLKLIWKVNNFCKVVNLYISINTSGKIKFSTWYYTYFNQAVSCTSDYICLHHVFFNNLDSLSSSVFFLDFSFQKFSFFPNADLRFYVRSFIILYI